MPLRKTYLPITLALCSMLVLAACYKDKGNYTYHKPDEPLIALDSVYNVLIGDSLVIKPRVQYTGTDTFSYEWKISLPDNTTREFKGPELHMLYGLGAARYAGLLTAINHNNGMHYFYPFVVSGETVFSEGVAVLTAENGKAQVSFIKANGEVLSRIYQVINPNDTLPDDPIQIIKAVEVIMEPDITRCYWVLGKSGKYKGVQIDVNTFARKGHFEDNFFDVPDTVAPQNFCSTIQGVLAGVSNGRMYAGTTSTWDQAPNFGMFGLDAAGDYTMHPSFIYNTDKQGSQQYFIGFDTKHSQFVRMNMYGGLVYFGPAYAVTGGAFNPINLGMDLITMMQIDGGNCFAFCKDASGAVQELKFSVEFNGPFNFNPIYQHTFAHPELITGNTKWIGAPGEIIYFTSNDKIYRYNPLNQDLRTLTADMGGKAVTMIKLMEDGTLAAGTENTLYYLNISGGNTGTVLRKVEGLPGNVIDIVNR
ncbi:PKD-like family lipoprotein [Deminuibacter soli]|uniref:PKD-like family protein n=1 Tax=Deminuibacter soli TaxID=2291815 RepID=A0A3E1NJU1_9BACT|nr:PKD-like family lipoprotein [Deminuibacter soli]RFM28205.1 hypothetical protein DXN05_11840 [Deminuibacter soli]